MPMPMWLAVITAIVTVIFGALRFIVPVEGRVNRKDIFKDLAHIWVGFLMGLAIAYPTTWVLAIGITIFEVVAFAARKK